MAAMPMPGADSEGKLANICKPAAPTAKPINAIRIAPPSLLRYYAHKNGGKP
ncbi:MULTISPECIES: hypothetical protein [unclassified Duganella]|uniref:hypothetical protein n=1 Tax=unclassified Duganella TaxID=2636909 RepID=UPI001E3535EB|nr:MULTISPECIES: hypothetical protein [unclassified Duganella]